MDLISIGEELADDHARLDRLPETYLVCKEVALDRILEDTANDVHLMRVDVDARGDETGQPAGDRSFVDHLPHEREAVVVEVRCLLAAEDQDVERVPSDPRCPDVDVGLG